MEHGPLTGQKLQSRTRRAATQARHYCFSSNIQVMVLGLQTLQLGLASLILSKRCRCFQCLKDHEDSLSRCFECSSFRDFLKLIPDADENKANEDSFHIFQMCLKEVLRAAGASESESMKNKLAWLKKKNYRTIPSWNEKVPKILSGYSAATTVFNMLSCRSTI